MSLCLLDQRLGSRSAADNSSHKFSLKGRQSGGIHRGHSWVFRAESYDTMMAWYEDIRNLTEKSGAEKNEYVRRHARSVSAGSHSAPSVSSDGVESDEADEVPYAAGQPAKEPVESPVKRPSPGGRFPSDININRVRDLQSAPSDSGSSYQENEPMMSNAAAHSAPRAQDPEGRQVREGAISSPLQAHTIRPFNSAAAQGHTNTEGTPGARLDDTSAKDRIIGSDTAASTQPAMTSHRTELGENVQPSERGLQDNRHIGQMAGKTGLEHSRSGETVPERTQNALASANVTENRPSEHPGYVSSTLASRTEPPANGNDFHVPGEW